MSFRPNSVLKGDVEMAKVDTSQAALKWPSPPTGSIRMKVSNLRSSSGVSHRELAMPHTAPLIYPDTGCSKISKIKDKENSHGSTSPSRKVAQAYFDKRAHAKDVSP